MLDNPPLLTIHRGHRRPDPPRCWTLPRRPDLAPGRCHGRAAAPWTGRSSRSIPACAAFVGPALTAFAYPADIVGVYGAWARPSPATWWWWPTTATRATAVFGDLVAGMMKNNGVAAFVTDGLARDKAGILAVGMPVFAAGIVPTSPAANGPGVVGAPVVCGGVRGALRRHRRRRCRWRGGGAARAGRGGAGRPRPGSAPPRSRRSQRWRPARPTATRSARWWPRRRSSGRLNTNSAPATGRPFSVAQAWRRAAPPGASPAAAASATTCAGSWR